MDDTDLRELLQRLRSIETRTRAVENGVYTILLFLCIAAFILVIDRWGPWPALLVLLLLPIAIWCGRTAARRAQAHLDGTRQATGRSAGES